MGWAQILSGVALVAGLLAVAGYFVYFQVRTLRRLAGDPDLSHDEARFQRHQAYRRIAAAVLMLLLALLLVGALLFLENPAQALADKIDAHPDTANPPPLTPEQRDFARLYGWFWMVFLGLLLGLLAVAAWDHLATRRFTRQQQREINDARRAMIAQERDRLRGG